MKDSIDSTDGSEEMPDGSDREENPEEKAVSRREILKRGAYAAPAIMTIGSVPSLGSDCASPAHGGSGSGSHDCSASASTESTDITNGYADGDSGRGTNPGRNSTHQGNGYRSNGYGSDSYGSDDYQSDSYGSGFGDDD